VVRLRAPGRAAAAAFLRGGVRFVLAAGSADSALVAGFGVALRGPAFARALPDPEPGTALAGALRAALVGAGRLPLDRAGAAAGAGGSTAAGSATTGSTAAGSATTVATGSARVGGTNGWAVATGSDTGPNDGSAATDGLVG